MIAVDWKERTREQWNNRPCGSPETIAEDLQYFLDLEAYKYSQDRWIKEVLPFASCRDRHVLEIGYGQGNDLVQFAKHGAICSGIDITPRHYELAGKNFRLRGLTADLRLGDAASLPFPDNHFDLVYSMGVLHHTPDTVRCIGEAYRVLKPGGRLIIAMYHKYSAFHIFRKLLYDGFVKGDLKRLGYAGLLSTIEQGADGVKTAPLVKLYSKRQLKIILSDFRHVDFKVRHLDKDHFGLLVLCYLVPQFAIPHLEPFLGWYLIGSAVK